LRTPARCVFRNRFRILPRSAGSVAYLRLCEHDGWRGAVELAARDGLCPSTSWPTAQALAAVSREQLIQFARAQRTGYLQRFADTVQAALARDQFAAPPHLVRAKADTIRLTAAKLLLIDAQRKAWEKRMGELLLGAASRPTQRQRRKTSRGRRFLAARST
jgi:hypothetical protein